MQALYRKDCYHRCPRPSPGQATLNDKVLLLFAEHGIPLLRILTDRGTEYCGKAENHAYQLYLAVEDIDHTRTKASSPQTNGICERFHRTLKQEFYDIAFRKNSKPPWKSYRLTLMNTCASIITNGLTQENTAMAKHPCRPSVNH